MGQAGYRVVDRVTGHVRTKGVDIDIDIRVMSHGGGGGRREGVPLSLSLSPGGGTPTQFLMYLPRSRFSCHMVLLSWCSKGGP